MTNTALIRRQLEAVTKMLLSDDRLQPGLATIASGELDGGAIAELARMAQQCDTDIICLEFNTSRSAPKMTGITVIAHRDGVCHISTGCRLTLDAGATRAKLLPGEGARGYFHILPNEVVHVNGATPDLRRAGIHRANARLRALTRDGVDLAGQVLISSLAA